MNNKVEKKAIFIYFCHNPELITQKLKVFRVSSIFYMNRLQHLQSVVGKKHTWCWSALQPISTMLVVFKHLMFSPFHASGRGWRARLELGLHLLFGSTI